MFGINRDGVDLLTRRCRLFWSKYQYTRYSCFHTWLAACHGASPKHLEFWTWDFHTCKFAFVMLTSSTFSTTAEKPQKYKKHRSHFNTVPASASTLSLERRKNAKTLDGSLSLSYTSIFDANGGHSCARYDRLAFCFLIFEDFARSRNELGIAQHLRSDSDPYICSHLNTW